MSIRDALPLTATLITLAGTADPGSAQQALPVFDPPLSVPDAVEVRHDVHYREVDGRTLALDLFLPSGGTVAARPAVLFFNGFGRDGGGKAQFWRHAAHMAGLGFVAATVDYRFWEEALFPAAVTDAKAAVRWIRAHAAELGVDPGRIAVVGASSGGHVASLVGVTDDGEMDDAERDTALSARVQAVVAFNPALDFVDFAENPMRGDAASDPRIRYVTEFLGAGYAADPGLWRRASPITHVDDDAAAFLLQHGTRDFIPYPQAVRMADALRAAGVHAEVELPEGALHGFFNFPPHYAPALERMAGFLVRALGDGAR